MEVLKVIIKQLCWEVTDLGLSYRVQGVFKPTDFLSASSRAVL